jgi:2-dehydro-3-deoxyphosphooctonate aldolase (KDO 8-P synthase)
MTRAQIGGFEVGDGSALLLICGPDVIESEAMTLSAAETVQALARKHGLPLVFKCSFDKANRTSLKSFRGPGIEKGLEVLARVKRALKLPLLTDVHEAWQAPKAAEVVDVLQVPAFLCRQTDLLVACAKSGKAVNVKKGQFVAPSDMRHPLGKLKESGCANVLLTERGTCLGYNNLVVDMRSLSLMRELGAPVCFDATHSVQLPSAAGGESGGQREHIRPLARAAVAAGVDALFLEVHENPDQALCDGKSSLDFAQLDELLTEVAAIRRALGQK